MQIEAKMAAAERGTGGLSLVRLYMLRFCYLVMAVGLGIVIWPSVIAHTSEFAMKYGVRCSLLAGLGAMAALGLRYPVKMLPVLLFEILWKAIYLIGFALPLWRAHQMNEAVVADVFAISLVVIFLPMVPWRYTLREFLLAKSERWR
ncbi:MAG: hypothetical protein WCA89_00050 [Terracidiphilus sp.]|jgi:hypothetical protein